MRPFYLDNGNSYAGKKVSLYWDGPLLFILNFGANETDLCTKLD